MVPTEQVDDAASTVPAPCSVGAIRDITNEELVSRIDELVRLPDTCKRREWELLLQERQIRADLQNPVNLIAVFVAMMGLLIAGIALAVGVLGLSAGLAVPTVALLWMYLVWAMVREVGDQSSLADRAVHQGYRAFARDLWDTFAPNSLRERLTRQPEELTCARERRQRRQ